MDIDNTSKVKYCTECPHHLVIKDPDPTDRFNDDDKAVVCKKALNDRRNMNGRYHSDRSKYKPIDVALRPYEVKNISIPSWCPLELHVKNVIA